MCVCVCSYSLGAMGSPHSSFLAKKKRKRKRDLLCVIKQAGIEKAIDDYCEKVRLNTCD